MGLTIITDPRCTEYAARGHPERPERISRTVEFLKNQDKIKLAWTTPGEASDASILRAHTREHLEGLQSACDFDGDTPAHPGILGHARRSAGGALAALAAARAAGRAFSLMRPPGHHATGSRAMGFCYLNSIAIAALEAQAAGFKRVAVFDFDVHHGNGTEEILLDKPGMAFISIHQYPAYPGTGRHNRGGNCFNFPVAPGTPAEEYRAVLGRGFEELKKFRPDMVGVSAGFDAYKGDPLADERLEAGDYQWLGETIRNLGVPSFSVLEGGYSEELPELIFAYLRGLTGEN
ncbi:MAG TPA: histone deacetylase [Verrucomicrobiae bacterium]|nr:histone deacetylase [Verrucomicrobiae bacterium]